METARFAATSAHMQASSLQAPSSCQYNHRTWAQAPCLQPLGASEDVDGDTGKKQLSTAAMSSMVAQIHGLGVGVQGLLKVRRDPPSLSLANSPRLPHIAAKSHGARMQGQSPQGDLNWAQSRPRSLRTMLRRSDPPSDDGTHV